MHRVILAGGLAAVVLAAAALWWAGQPVPAPAAIPPDNTREIVLARVSPGYAGCSAVACHGGPVDPSAPNPARWAFNFWSDHDKHSRAYAVLSEPRSQEIMKNLALPGEPVGDATRDARCLACHSLPTSVYADKDHWDATDDRPEARALRTQGVTCSACHGKAEGWDYDHIAWSGQMKALSGGPAEKEKAYRKLYADKGVTWLNGAADRGAVCAGCHVGAPPDRANNVPVRDMNHDMIAAGHPRLSFELALYEANMPPHWKERERATGAARGPEFDACLWRAGQTTSAEAALRLLAHEATVPADGSVPPPWPELARFDCYACHHHLSRGPDGKESVREEQQGLNKRPPGALWANPWEVSWPLRRLAAGEESLPGQFAAFEKAMYRPSKRGEIRRAAEKLAEAIGKMPTTPGCEVGPLLEALALTGEDVRRLGWDDAAQLYMALSALERAAPDAERRAKLDELAKGLRFRTDIDKKTGKPIFVDTPDFPDREPEGRPDPRPLLQQLLPAK